MDSSEVLALAAKLYPDPSLSRIGPHTVSCTVGLAMTLIPIPTGSGESFAGLITLQLPPGIHVGDSFNVVIRWVTSRRIGEDDRTGDTLMAAAVADDSEAADDSERVINWRYVVGMFQMQVPVRPTMRSCQARRASSRSCAGGTGDWTRRTVGTPCSFDGLV